MDRKRQIFALVGTFAFFAGIHVAISLGRVMYHKQLDYMNIFNLSGIDLFFPMLGQGMVFTILSYIFAFFVFIGIYTLLNRKK